MVPTKSRLLKVLPDGSQRNTMNVLTNHLSLLPGLEVWAHILP